MKSENTKYCQNEGSLVGGEHWIPDSPFDGSFSNRYSFAGCNQVFCDKCGQYVRQKRGCNLNIYDLPNNAKVAAKVFASDHWIGLEGIKQDDSDTYRIYCCQCSIYVERGSTHLDGTDDHLIYGAQQPTSWHCNGHPPLSFPTEIYGVLLKKPQDVTKVFLAIMEHREAIHDPIHRQEMNPEAFLINRFYALLDMDESKSPIEKMMAKFLNHPDALYRSVACIHLERFPESRAASKLVAVYMKHPELFDGVLHPKHALGTEWDRQWRLFGLDHQIQKALLAFLKFSNSHSAQKLLRKLILCGKMKANWSNSHDGVGKDWIEANLKKIYAVNPKASLTSLFPYSNNEDLSMFQAWAIKLKDLNLLPEKEFLDALPSSIALAFQPQKSPTPKRHRRSAK